MTEKRPDPESLLARAQEEEREESSGKLKIFFGAAPGVGKTYAMLEEARAKHLEGLDVVIGIVESHGRKETEALLKDLPILPRREFEYRGMTMHEFDLDAALARSPALILVDEMAHSNAGNSRHAKRWQDIKELLDRGIDVYTTLNVQHLESLNDIVSQITGVVVRETVPDSMVEQADAVEIIDLPPVDLLKRLHDGKVYLPENAKLATQHFFREGNLTALRELALRVTAERVNAQVLTHRRDQSIAQTWPTVERLLVCVGPTPGSAKLIRATRRLAVSLHAQWIAIYVETPDRLRLPEQQRQIAIQNLRFAEQLGGESLILSGNDMVEEIINFARARNVTKIVIGKQIRPRWKEMFHRSLVNELILFSGEIDIYIIRGDDLEEKKPRFSLFQKRMNSGYDYLKAIMITALATFIGFLTYDIFEPADLILVYLMGVVIIAAKIGRGPSIVASILSIAAYDYFFVISPYSLAIEGTHNLLHLGVMLVTTLVISHLTFVTREQAKISRLRERRTAAMHALSRQLASHRGVQTLLDIAVRQISEVFDSEVLALLPDEKGRLMIKAGHRVDFSMDPKEQSVAQWVYDLGQMAGLGTQTLPFVDAVYLPLLGSLGPVGALRVRPKEAARLIIPEQLRLLEAFANQIALALEVDRYQEEKRNQQVLSSPDKPIL